MSFPRCCAWFVRSSVSLWEVQLGLFQWVTLLATCIKPPASCRQSSARALHGLTVDGTAPSCRISARKPRPCGWFYSQGAWLECRCCVVLCDADTRPEWTPLAPSPRGFERGSSGVRGETSKDEQRRAKTHTYGPRTRTRMRPRPRARAHPGTSIPVEAAFCVIQLC